MGAPLKSITQMRGAMSKKKLADRRDMEESLFTYQELVDQPPTWPVSYTHLRAHETRHDLVCRLLLEKKKISGSYTHLRAHEKDSSLVCRLT